MDPEDCFAHGLVCEGTEIECPIEFISQAWNKETNCCSMFLRVTIVKQVLEEQNQVKNLGNLNAA